MDKITDILTTFFVNSKKNNNNKKENSNITTQPEPEPELKSEPKQEPNSSSDTSSNTSSNSSSHTSSKSSSDTTESIFSKKESKQESKKESKPDFKPESIYSDLSSLQTNKKKAILEKEREERVMEERVIEERVMEERVIEEKEREEKEMEEKGLKKYILKPSEFYKKNIMIINDNLNDNISFLGDFLYKLSMMKDLTSIYDNDIHIIASIENKKLYKQMLLDNPYLYFTNFDVKQTLTKKKINELDSNSHRTIYIIDNEILKDKNDVLKTLLYKNIQIIIISNDDDKTSLDSYNLLGNNRLMIHKPNKLKLFQKKFYKNYIKKICNIQTFDEYYDMINNENLDIKYIILKDKELRYN